MKKSKRPDAKEIAVQVPVDGVEKARRGADLDSILGGLVWDLCRDWQVSQVEAGRLLGGIDQQQVSRIIRVEGTTLKFLSMICASQGATAMEFLAAHPYWREKDGLAAVPFHAPFKDFKSVLSDELALRILRVLQRLNARMDGSLERYIQYGEAETGLSGDTSQRGRPRKQARPKK